MSQIVSITEPLVYIFDTNVWLDWLVFSHDAVPILRDLQHAKKIRIVYTSEMKEELADVLSRPQFKLSDIAQAAALQTMAGYADEVAACASTQVRIACKDIDDQVFIDTALGIKAAFLLSKDKHLLVLRKRAVAHGVTICTLDAWLSAHLKNHQQN